MGPSCNNSNYGVKWWAVTLGTGEFGRSVETCCEGRVQEPPCARRLGVNVGQTQTPGIRFMICVSLRDCSTNTPSCRRERARGLCRVLWKQDTLQFDQQIPSSWRSITDTFCFWNLSLEFHESPEMSHAQKKQLPTTLLFCFASYFFFFSSGGKLIIP